MKKYLYLLLVLPFFLNCSDDDNEETQDYTSYIIKAPNTDVFLSAMTGYYNEDGKCILIDSIGDINAEIDSKEFILHEYYNEIYLFYKLADVRYTKLENSLYLTKNKQNKLILKGKGINIPEINEYTWPH